ncbi:MAG: DUF58 domain-containing protein [Actinomyces sp.]|nr:DUF58 domain-containing protein [Actinomyces sp.]MCI1788135.1 DUF58 domain-containing protein [Actinomyces sp.]MCI1830282.1 DUF58 domain-containing protein [Actinomyces sp.]MCI1867428.1 DUF58 domain-containing protein [Actinomyces sp.]
MSARVRHRLLPTPRGWGVLALGGAAAVAWAVLRLREVLLLAVLCAAALLVALVWAALALAWARPSVRLTAPVPTPTMGETSMVLVQARHRFPALLPLTLAWRVDEDVQRTARIDAPSGRGAQAELRAPLGRRRRHTVSADRVTVEDRLGLARMTARPAGRSSVDLVVLPRVLGIEALPMGAGGEGAEAARPGAGEPAGNLRDYRAGDALRLVHWKQTARQGRLLVNIPEAGSGRRHTIALVTAAEAYAGRDEAFELAVSVVATLSLEWLGRGEDVTVGLGARTLAFRPGDADRLMLALAEVMPDGGAAEAAERGPEGGVVLVDADVAVAGSLTQGLRRTLDARFPGLPRGLLLLTGPGAAPAGMPAGWRAETVAGGGGDGA